MADFCKQCSVEVFGMDTGDLKGLLTKEESDAGMVVCVICEGCGYVEVNHEGACVATYCAEHGGSNQQEQDDGQE